MKEQVASANINDYKLDMCVCILQTSFTCVFLNIAESYFDLTHSMFINVFLNFWPEDLKESLNEIGSLSRNQDLTLQHFDCQVIP